MDYAIRHGLEFNPFLKNSKEIFVATDESKEVLFRLDYLTKTKGLGPLTGSPGRGKTTAIRNWAQTLNHSQHKVVHTCFSTFSPDDLYRNLATELGAQAHYRKPNNFRVIQEELTRLSVEKRKTPVIIVDEANYISSAILNDFKLLFNFGMDSRDRAVVLLSGLPSLNAILRLGVHEPFRQRIIMSYELPALTKGEGRSYILEKLQGAGATRAIFEDAALEAILNAPGGTPRIINNLCNSCLLIGDSGKSGMITAGIVTQAIINNEI